MRQSNTIETMGIISYHNHIHTATEPTAVPVDRIKITIVHSIQKLSCLIILEVLISNPCTKLIIQFDMDYKLCDHSCSDDNI